MVLVVIGTRADGMHDYYILNGHEPVQTSDMEAWGVCFNSKDRVVAVSENQYFTLSTVFLCSDHQYRSGPPILFETMIFVKKPYEDIIPQSESLDQACYRYSTWDDASAGHEAQLKVLTRQVETARLKVFKGIVAQTVAAIEEHVAGETAEEGFKP